MLWKYGNICTFYDFPHNFQEDLANIRLKHEQELLAPDKKRVNAF